VTSARTLLSDRSLNTNSNINTVCTSRDTIVFVKFVGAAAHLQRAPAPLHHETVGTQLLNRKEPPLTLCRHGLQGTLRHNAFEKLAALSVQDTNTTNATSDIPRLCSLYRQPGSSNGHAPEMENSGKSASRKAMVRQGYAYNGKAQG